MPNSRPSLMVRELVGHDADDLRAVGDERADAVEHGSDAERCDEAVDLGVFDRERR